MRRWRFPTTYREVTLIGFAKERGSYMRSNAKEHGVKRPSLLGVTADNVDYICETVSASGMVCADPNCIHKGVPMELRAGRSIRNPLRASPDCIDCDLGYKIGNIRWVHAECNIVRGNRKD